MIGWKCGVFLVALCQPLYAELLVVKKDAAGMIAALDNADEARYLAAMNILMKYQWPMCTISQLTEDEQKELLSPGVPAAEENFIRKKIKALDQNLDVVFVPTTIYELFCLRTSLESAGWLKMAEDINFNEANPKKEFVTAFDQMNLLQQVLMYASKEDADEIDRPYEEAAQKTMHDVYAVYGRENDRYLNFNFANISPAFSKLLHQSTSIYFYINR